MAVVFPRRAQQCRCGVAAQQLGRDIGQLVQCGGQRRQVRVEDGVSQHRIPGRRLARRPGRAICNAIWPPDSRNSNSSAAECGQQSVADDGADADRPQPRGEAEEEDRRGDSRLRGTEAGLHSLDDAAQQVAVGVELVHGAPAVVDRPGADGEIGVDRRESRPARPVGLQCCGSAGAQKRRDIDARQLSRDTTAPVRRMRRRECPGSRIAARLAFQLAAVASEVRSPMTVAGPRRIRTGFLHRHRLTRALSHSRDVAVRN